MAVGREKLLGYGIPRCRLFPAIAFVLNTALNMPGAPEGAWHVFTVVPILCQPRRAAPSSDHIPLLSGRPVCATMGATYGEIRHSESIECTCNRLSGSTFPNLILTHFLGFRLYRDGRRVGSALLARSTVALPIINQEMSVCHETRSA